MEDIGNMHLIKFWRKSPKVWGRAGNSREWTDFWGVEFIPIYDADESKMVFSSQEKFLKLFSGRKVGSNARKYDMRDIQKRKPIMEEFVYFLCSIP